MRIAPKETMRAGSLAESDEGGHLGDRVRHSGGRGLPHSPEDGGRGALMVPLR